MAISASEIRNIEFSPAQNEPGYSPVEVDEFLERISSEVETMLTRFAELTNRYKQSMSEASGLRQQLRSLEQSRVDGQLSESQLSEVMVIAKQTSDKMVEDAKKKARDIEAEAERKASETVRQALADKQKEIDEINRLQQSRAQFLSDYQGLLRSYLEESATRVPISAANMAGVKVEQTADTAPEASDAAIDIAEDTGAAEEAAGEAKAATA